MHRDAAYARGRQLASKMRELIPRQMFEVAIQAAGARGGPRPQQLHHLGVAPVRRAAQLPESVCRIWMIAGPTITSNIAGVAQAAESTSRGASDTQKAAQQLVETSAELRRMVEQFKIRPAGDSPVSSAPSTQAQSRAAYAGS